LARAEVFERLASHFEFVEEVEAINADGHALRLDAVATCRSTGWTFGFEFKNCHKLTDDDPIKYPAGLLFEWQQDHEQKIAEKVGKAGAELRRKYETQHLEEFGRLSYLAERIITKKDDLWEYRLTGEGLRFEMKAIIRSV
jgi:hypothetical protein